jgi:hypothetical protein
MSSPIFDSTFGTGRFRREEAPFTPKEDRMTITDSDLNYLRNISTRPGPGAGRSIDPTKPGPDADRASPEPQNVRETPGEIARKLAVIELGVSDETFIGKIAAAIRAALAQSDAELAADARLIEAAEWLSTAANRFEEAADALRSEYKTYARQMDRRWAGVHGELIPDCPTEGVAARQGNGG